MTRASKTQGRCIRVRVPATTSNLGPGFDVLGMALKLYNELELTALDAPEGLIIEIEGEGASSLPCGESNAAVEAFRAALPKGCKPRALRLRMKNRIPLGRGLGSSAAARLCGLLAGGAVHDFKERPLERLIQEACRMEGHPDNTVPAFYGGLCVSFKDGESFRHLRLKLPKGLGVSVCVPDFQVSTEKARALLPRKVDLRDAVRNSSRLALLVAALEQGRFGWLKIAMQDSLHQPYRKRLVRGMDSVIAAAERAGAFGAALSGSGPTILALTPKGTAQARVGRAMEKAFARAGAKSRALALEIDTEGARVEIVS